MLDGDHRAVGDARELPQLVLDLQQLHPVAAHLHLVVRPSEERDGWRYTAFVTNTQVGALQWLEARHRAHARVEDRIRCAKDTGLRRLPSREFAINQAWCVAAAIATDLIAWLQIYALDGDLAKAEPKRLRYRLLHTAARLIHGQRRRWLRVPATWPWADQLTAAFTRITAIPAPG